MLALFGLIGLTIKIAILAIVYASSTLFLLLLLSKTTSISWVKKIMQLKFKTWFITGFLYSILLFCYSFSFWGYAGLGDYFRIPVSNGFVVSSIDAQSTSYFEPDKETTYSRQGFMNDFAMKDNKICGEFLGFNRDDCVDCFIVFDTQAKKIYEFNSSKDYIAFATRNDLPQPNGFKSFGENYWSYWSGRKSWFLP